ncbi:hypothetical protein [Alkaliphilus serpentinus]|uniref:Uncharacterized protein n=1 Tax=Alkaliphilus serpentinus TaxID=1482731 RepID=A0A833HND2_9FIRM|nr:hypothetical protein [Alkaliphilus serpentinus]KAB3529415.1 hypothetical protein F8153_09280 [Alkaliphilus serpentinus]
MKKSLLVFFVVITLFVYTGCNTNKTVTSRDNSEDKEAILKTSLDYIEGWYEGDPKEWIAHYILIW